METAANRLLGLTQDQITDRCRDIIAEQIRHIIAGMTYDQLDSNPDRFFEMLSEHVTSEIHLIGIDLIEAKASMEEGDEGGFIRRKAPSM